MMKKLKVATVVLCVMAISFSLASPASYCTGSPLKASLHSSGQFHMTTFVSDTSRDSIHYDVTAFKRNWDKKLKKLDARIDKEQKKIKHTSADQRQKLNQRINELKMKRDELQQEVNAAGNKTADQWDEFKEDVNRKYRDLSMQVKDFFKGD